MAFAISLPQTNIGIPLTNTYARITLLRCDKDQCLMQVSHYANSKARQASANPVYDRTVIAPTNELKPGNDPLAIGYAWLKTQPEYAGAVDC